MNLPSRLRAAISAGQAVRPSIEDRISIGDAITSLALHMDLLDWEQVEARLAAEVTTDFVSVLGGEPRRQTRSALIEEYRSILPGFHAVQHMIGVVDVHLLDRTVACSRSNLRATHRLDDAIWTLGGVYTHELTRSGEGWAVSGIHFAVSYNDGDTRIAARAAERALRSSSSATSNAA